MEPMREMGERVSHLVRRIADKKYLSGGKIKERISPPVNLRQKSALVIVGGYTELLADRSFSSNCIAGMICE